MARRYGEDGCGAHDAVRSDGPWGPCSRSCGVCTTTPRRCGPSSTTRPGWPRSARRGPVPCSRTQTAHPCVRRRVVGAVCTAAARLPPPDGRGCRPAYVTLRRRMTLPHTRLGAAWRGVVCGHRDRGKPHWQDRVQRTPGYCTARALGPLFDPSVFLFFCNSCCCRRVYVCWVSWALDVAHLRTPFVHSPLDTRAHASILWTAATGAVGAGRCR